MNSFINRKEINLGTNPLHSGHVVYSGATYTGDDGSTQRIIYKENKYDDPELSRFEVAFGELARVFMSPGLTPPQHLVKDDHQDVLGVASEYVGQTIFLSEGLAPCYYTIRPTEDTIQCSRTRALDANEIPFYFLKDFAPGFFKKMCDAEKRSELTLDLHSLANVLGASYSLEEDDLHKGNFGFYIIEKDHKPHVVFFKIDHDLMMAESVMSHCQSRFLNWLNFSDAFKITKRDLLNFPVLTDSKNYYWPTVKRFFGFDSTIAYNADERQAFAELAQSQEFRQHKWQVLFKHVLIPVEVIQNSLEKHLDENNPVERAKISLITQSVVARQAKLRAVLFSIPEFREYVQGLDATSKAQLAHHATHSLSEVKESLVQEVLLTIEQQQTLCIPGVGFEEGDTPLHAAIRLGDYRYNETWDAFGSFAHDKNAKGQTALDVAACLGKAWNTQAPAEDSHKSPFKVMSHLLCQNVKETEFYKNSELAELVKSTNHLVDHDYSRRAKAATNYQELKEIIRDLGEDHRFSLKMQKELVIGCVRQFTDAQHHNPDLQSVLQQFKAELNGTATVPPAPELQFIRQLRSQLWIVRIIRGLFGGTFTQVTLNKMLDRSIQDLTPKKPWGFFTFFGGGTEETALAEDHPKPSNTSIAISG